MYDPGGHTIVVDDFCVADPAAWTTAGGALLRAACERVWYTRTIPYVADH